MGSEFPKTPACYLRFAEEALRAHDYDRAISLYEKLHDAAGGDGALLLPVEYYHGRWAIALILAGKEAEGVRLLREVQSAQTVPTHFIDAILQAYLLNPSTFSVCLAAYDFVWLNPYHFWIRELADVGRTDDNIIYPRGMYSPPPASPIDAGCDAPTLFNAFLREHTFTMQSDPTTQLAAFDIPYQATFQDDLNGDGIDDWLINLKGWRTLFFVSDDAIYRASYADMSVPDEVSHTSDQLVSILLPNDSGVALIRTRYGEVYMPIPLGYGFMVEPGHCEASGEVQIARLDDYILTPVLVAPLCEIRTLSALVDDLPVVSQVHAWIFDDRMTDYVPATYAWDVMTSAYQRAPTR